MNRDMLELDVSSLRGRMIDPETDEVTYRLATDAATGLPFIVNAKTGFHWTPSWRELVSYAETEESLAFKEHEDAEVRYLVSDLKADLSRPE